MYSCLYFWSSLVLENFVLILFPTNGDVYRNQNLGLFQNVKKVTIERGSIRDIVELRKTVTDQLLRISEVVE